MAELLSVDKIREDSVTVTIERWRSKGRHDVVVRKRMRDLRGGGYMVTSKREWDYFEYEDGTRKFIGITSIYFWN